MKTLRHLDLVLALALAVVLPLEQAHCMWMGLPRHGAPVAAKSAVHACCARAAARAQHSAPAQPASAGCQCPQLPSVVLSGHTSVAPASAPIAAFAVPEFVTPGAPAPATNGIAPAPDVGSSPLPHDPGAHGLRAPPLPA